MLLLETAGAKVDEVEMSFWKRILDTLIDPNAIVILMSIGVLGITIELWANPDPPRHRRSDLADHRPVRLADPSRQSWAGVLLLLLAAGFFVAEMFSETEPCSAAPLAGAVAFVIGSLMLFDPAGEGYQVSLQVALGVAATMALMVGLVVLGLVQVRRAEVVTGQEELIGQVGIVARSSIPSASSSSTVSLAGKGRRRAHLRAGRCASRASTTH